MAARIAILAAQIPVIAIMLILRRRGVLSSRTRQIWIVAALQFFFVIGALLLVEFVIRKP